MNIVIAPDSFKGTLSSEQIIEIIAAEARLHFPEAAITGVPIADGGEGTLQAVLTSRNGRLRHIPVTNPVFEKIEASYGILESSDTEPAAMIEMAAVVSHCFLPPKKALSGLLRMAPAN